MTPFTPDFEKYYNYINYFNGFDIEIGYGQGVIYYYLVSFFLKRKIDLISKNNLDEVLSFTIQNINLLFFIIGLVGIYFLLKHFKYSHQTSCIVLILLSFFPPIINIRANMKQEIIAFAFLPWIIYFLETYIEKKESKYLLYIIPLITLLINSRASIAVLICIYLLINYFSILKKIFTKDKVVILLVLIFSLSLIQYENYSITGKQIHEREYDTEYDYKSDISIFYKIHPSKLFYGPDYNLVSPTIHSESLIDITLLDTFGDYFDLYFDLESSSFYENRKNFIVYENEDYLIDATNRKINLDRFVNDKKNLVDFKKQPSAILIYPNDGSLLWFRTSNGSYGVAEYPFLPINSEWVGNLAEFPGIPQDYSEEKFPSASDFFIYSSIKENIDNQLDKKNYGIEGWVYLGDVKLGTNLTEKPNDLRANIGLLISIIFYFYLIYFSYKDKIYRKFYLAPIIGIILLGINSLGYPTPNFNPIKADTFKTFYYAFFLGIAFSFLVAKLFSTIKVYKIIMIFIYVSTIFFIAGHPKDNSQVFSEKLVAQNEYSIFCNINNTLLFDNSLVELLHTSGNVNNLKSDCKNKSISKQFLTYSILKSDIDFPSCLMSDGKTLNQDASTKRGCRAIQFDLIKKKDINYLNRIPVFSLFIFIISNFVIIFNLVISNKNNKIRILYERQNKN